MPADPRVIPHREEALIHLARTGRALELQQVERAGPLRGNVSPWASREVESFHGTLMAIWVWARHEALTGQKRFAENRELSWRYVLEAALRFVPDELPPDAYEAPFDASCLLLAAIADKEAGTEESRQALAELGSETLRKYITKLGADAGREFRDPGFAVWALAEYAKVFSEDRAVRAALHYVEYFFGTESPPPPAKEVAPEGTLFDFLSTTATRVLASVAAQGETPFTRLWLEERVVPVLPKGFTKRRVDENPWNASVAWMLGRAYSETHAPEFLDPYFAIVDELVRRDADGDGALGRDADPSEGETLPSWAWAMAMDALRGG